jgi:hypothetical protein
MSESAAKLERQQFKLTEKQEEACQILNFNEHALAFGGSRAGKTFIILRNIVVRAIKVESRHLVVRFRFNHVKTSIIYDTFPKVMKICFPELKEGVHWKLNKSDWFVSIKNSQGTWSQIWFGGIDDKERVEKILGNEYSTIHANECSQISYDAITTLRTRLAENSGLKLRFYYDLNPCGKSHWTYKEFVEHMVPETKNVPSELQCNYIIMNPKDNQDNLPEAYLKGLQQLPDKKKKRFWEGIYLSDVEGALWKDEDINNARSKKHGTVIRSVVAIDPTVSNDPDSDECGMVVAGIDEHGTGVVMEDLSAVMTTKEWAQCAVNAYNNNQCACIVAEKNNGGELVKDAIKAIDPLVPVKLVWAAKGKFARAEPVQELYDLGKVAHDDIFVDLDAQLTEWVPHLSKKSPDRLDALVWALTFLMLKVKSPATAREL